MTPASLTAHFRPHHLAGRYIVFEGDPGAGKTSVLRALRGSQQGLVLSEIDHVADGLAEAGRPEITRWYLGAESARQPSVRKALQAGGSIVQDRSVLSTFAFAYAKDSGDSGELSSCVAQAARLGPFILPDVLMILTVEPRVGRARRAYASHRAEYGDWFEPTFLDRFHDFYCGLSGPGLAKRTARLDTTDLSLEEAVRRVLAELELSPIKPNAYDRL
jgi:thymidylate kinase